MKALPKWLVRFSQSKTVDAVLMSMINLGVLVSTVWAWIDYPVQGFALTSGLFSGFALAPWWRSVFIDFRDWLRRRRYGQRKLEELNPIEIYFLAESSGLDPNEILRSKIIEARTKKGQR